MMQFQEGFANTPQAHTMASATIRIRISFLPNTIHKPQEEGKQVKPGMKEPGVTG